MSRRKIILTALCGAVVLLGATAARSAYVASSSSIPRPLSVVTDNDWGVIPDPPTADQDLTVIYRGDDEEVQYEVDGEKPVRVDVTKTGRFVIPRKAFQGKKGLTLVAHGGESGIRVIRF
ncbi:MAG TPA: hypothetical protein PKE00_09750 [Planctomycetota bacterium]|nr:hypothetical protein [Planctomycetota bacterium]